MGVLDFKEMSFGLLRVYNFLDTTRTREFLLEILRMHSSNMPKHGIDTMPAPEKAVHEPLNNNKEMEHHLLEDEDDVKSNLHGDFHFFSLPLELRYMIYGHCLSSRTAPALVPNLYIELHNLPNTTLLQVSKAFAAEYKHNATSLSSMTITDDCPKGQLDLYTQGVFKLPPLAFSARTLNLNIVLIHLDDGADHLDWISQLLLQLPSVRTVHLCAMLGRGLVTDCFDEFEIDTQWEGSLAMVTRLGSYKCYLRSYEWEGFEERRKVICEWDCETGRVEVMVEGKELDEEIVKAEVGLDEEWGRDEDEESDEDSDDESEEGSDDESDEGSDDESDDGRSDEDFDERSAASFNEEFAQESEEESEEECDDFSDEKQFDDFSDEDPDVGSNEEFAEESEEESEEE